VAVNGVATFAGLNMNRAGGYYLGATSTGLRDAVSKQFLVRSGPPASLAYISQPGTGTVGELFSNPVPALWCKDVFDNWASTCPMVTVALGANPGGATLRGLTTAGPTPGQYVIFDRLFLDRSGTGYTLVGSAPGLTPVTSDPFDIVPGAPFRMVFRSQPTSIVTGTAFDPVVVMEVLDYYGNRATNASGFVTLSVRGPNDIGPPFGTTLVGTSTVILSEGLAVFTGLSVTVPVERTLTLRAEMAGLGNVLSQAFVVRLF
jgi:hypothetical protein